MILCCLFSCLFSMEKSKLYFLSLMKGMKCGTRSECLGSRSREVFLGSRKGLYDKENFYG